MKPIVTIGDRPVGPGHPAYVIAEIGINHNGDIDIARQLIDVAVDAGCDAVKLQKRTPELCVPPEQRDVVRETPWGPMTYLDYKHRVELGETDYELIDRHCRDRRIQWFASPWDEPSVDFLDRFGVVAHKVASASLTDDVLLKRMAATGCPVILSTGMSTMEEIEHAVGVLEDADLVVTHSTSAYPCPPDELNLRMIPALASALGCPVGYSGHETGLQTTLAAVALGACVVERHITLDRTMWGSDHAASLEPVGLRRLVRDIRVIEEAMGDGCKRVYASELPIRAKLRRC